MPALSSLPSSSHTSILSGAVSFSSRSQGLFPVRFLSCQSNDGEHRAEACLVAAYDSEIDSFSSLRVVPLTLVAAEKEEAKAVLTLFLKKQGLSNAVAVRIINKSNLFIDHLVSRLHSVHMSRYLIGRELSTIEIRDALIPYLESLLKEYGDVLVDVVENFPDPPRKDKLVAAPSLSDLNLTSQKLKAVSRACELDSTGNLRPHIVYLIELGLSLEQIKGITRRFPAFAYYSLEGKVKPLVEFLLDLGVPKANIVTILVKRPQLCGISLTENLIPTMAYLEKLGVDKRKWAKVIYRLPALLTYSRQKFQTTLDFLLESGVSEDSIGKILTHCPNIMSYSVEEKLRPTSEYFQSMGVDIAFLLVRSPQTFGLSIESHLKPVTEFFLEKGYSLEEIKVMVSRYGSLYTFSLVENLVPKWEFYMTMDYPRSELVKFPQYFGYSLEQRIKPRYAQVKARGVRLLLNQLLSLTAPEFEKALDKKTRKALSGGE